MAKKQRSEEVLRDLKAITSHIIDDIDNVIAPLDNETLNKQPGEKRWSAAQCLEHLNRYGRFYLPLMEARIEDSRAKGQADDEWFKPGWLGNYMAKSMRPKGDHIPNKMNTFKNMNPVYSSVADDVVDEFRQQQLKYLDLLEKAEKVNINKNRVPTTLSKWLKMKLGDAFRLLIWHNQRHMIQAKRALNNGS